MPQEQIKRPGKPALSRRRAKIAECRKQEDQLNAALRDSFPASDPVSISQPPPHAPEEVDKA
ncbi:hypothetical protein [Ferrovibrio sp.]|uniref:hypothetical protein n=1 Tax=Ferrovibrio sp. TaxID=1917215 RepID=UPI00311DDB1F